MENEKISMSGKRYTDEFKIEVVKQVIERRHSVADSDYKVGDFAADIKRAASNIEIHMMKSDKGWQLFPIAASLQPTRISTGSLIVNNFFAAVVVTLSAIPASSYAAGNIKNTPDYRNAYQCATDALAHHDVDPKGGENGLTMYCIGNSHDPSKAELQGFRDAIRGERPIAQAAPTACTFAYGVYEANGSHADGFAEGRQTIRTLKEVAWAIQAHQVALYDRNNQPISSDVSRHWFVSKNGIEWKISPEARKACSRQQIG